MLNASVRGSYTYIDMGAEIAKVLPDKLRGDLEL